MAIAACCRLEKLISRDRIKRYGSRDVGYKPTDPPQQTNRSALAIGVQVFGYGIPGNHVIQLYAALLGEAPACQVCVLEASTHYEGAGGLCRDIHLDAPAAAWIFVGAPLRTTVYKPEQTWTDAPPRPEFTGCPVVRFIEGTRTALNTIYSEPRN